MEKKKAIRKIALIESETEANKKENKRTEGRNKKTIYWNSRQISGNDILCLYYIV